ncbi:MAG: hypothetical protein LBF50_03890 [Azoarcus sp.]|jgi:hypothetical protein|nr:hypothetical protein [Azoarcus sp.]
MMAAPPHTLVIGARGLEAWRHARNGGGAQAQTFAAADQDAPARLRAWLGGVRRRCTLVADVIDERHIIEYLPRVARADRRALIHRRLARHFPETTLTGAIALPGGGPENSAPVLLIALTRPALIMPWLEALGEAGAQGQVEVRGFTSAPFLLERWYRRQRGLPAQCLLLAPSGDGMRQLFFRQRRLAFSRVIPARAAALADCLPAYRDELAQTLAWLAAQRLSEGSPPIRILATASERAALGELIPADGNDDTAFIELISPSGTRDRARIEPVVHAEPVSPSGAQDSGESAQAVMHLLLREARLASAQWHYDCPRLQRLRRLAAVRRAMIAATAALVIAIATAAAFDLIAARRLRHETGQIDARRLALQDEIGGLEAHGGNTAPAEALGAWLDRAERLVRAPGIAPAAALDAAADLLAEAPWARLDALAWSMPGSDDPAPPTATSTSTATVTKARHADAAAAIHMTIAPGDTAPPPRSAADVLAARWSHRHGAPARVLIDASGARLRLDAEFKPPAIPAPPQENTP